MNRSRSLTITPEDMLFVAYQKERKARNSTRNARPSFVEVRDYKIAELDESSSSNSSEDEEERQR
jgi:hypothetical protein